MGRAPLLLAAALALSALAPRAQEPAPPAPPGGPAEPSAEILLYERDFELLLEEAGVPTAGQRELDRQLETLSERRSALAQREADLRRRQEAVSGSYTLVAAAEEMARQGVSDLRVAQESLRRQLEETRAQLAALSRQERELQEKRAR